MFQKSIWLRLASLLFLAFFVPAMAQKSETAPQPESPQDGISSTLAIDGIRIGMAYSQVLEVRGRPARLHEKRGLIVLFYPPPAHRSVETAVWFSQGKVVYASGYTLEENGEPLHLYGLPGTVLSDRFGPPQTLDVFASWWPDTGIVLAGLNNFFIEKPLQAPTALRDPKFPIEWHQSSEEKRFSTFEPWVDDETIVWNVDDVELGMSQDKAEKLSHGLDVVYRGGFVQAIKQPSEALLDHRLGHHLLSVNFSVGESFEEPTSPLLEKMPRTGWLSPTPSGRVRFQDGRVVELQLELVAPELFEALERLGPAASSEKK